ncbi:fungal protein [Schizosaccharomyces japonicus yFS275]|uniref:Fungal protein n=1 Tax=Schizosaccharomyces japonicus (strain yFS275 / FY16936) TaxID=402676 RepID=B6K3T1_SCHJY|nr:fungal protein [Schizosaccharomyces japonicus yFS275]EEB08138.1 fungal protein [Schizosaccharomyces japonicus yFS275]
MVKSPPTEEAPPSYDEVVAAELAELNNRKNQRPAQPSGGGATAASSPTSDVPPRLPHRPTAAPGYSPASPYTPPQPYQAGGAAYPGYGAQSAAYGVYTPTYPAGYNAGQPSYVGVYPSAIPGQSAGTRGAPFAYPPGYVCYKCHNTGVKSNGHPCGMCARMFARSLPVVNGRPPPGALVVQPGDPRIPGKVCGNCKGRGYVDYFLFTDTCPICRGIGKVQ